jgi:AcrR family transcriptional regulator
MAGLTDTVATRAVERATAARHAHYTEQIDRIVDATLDLIERTGRLDPPLRDVLAATGLSTQAFYRYFQSKDELLLLLLDDGRRKLQSYLDHRIAKARTPFARIETWIEGVLAQAARDDAAARTRPFVVHQARLSEAFPEDHQASIDLLIDQLAALVADLPGHASARPADVRRDAEAVYQLTFARLEAHLVRQSRPTPSEIAHLVDFARRGLGETTD